MQYYEINEQTARRANDVNSMSDYRPGSATEEYSAAVDKAAALVQARKAKISPYYHDKLDALLDRYARRLADYYNAYYRNESACPSILVCGGSNFPVRKKQKQNARRESLWQEYKEIDAILDKIRSVGTGAVDLTDPHARELLQDRLQQEQNALDYSKAANAYYRKHKTLRGYASLTDQQADALTDPDAFSVKLYGKPYGDFELSSLRGKTIGDTLYNGVSDFSGIIDCVLHKAIIPLLPLYICGTFTDMTKSGMTFAILGILWKVFIVVIIMHLVCITIQFLVAGTVSKKNPFTLIKNQIPGYTTALGTQSSAATIPVNLECAKKDGVCEQIRNFVVPLCANIHMAGSMITITACATAVCLMNQLPISLGTVVPFIMTLGVAMVASPGAPGGSIMTALPFLYMVFGAEAGDPDGAICAIMVALYITQDSFGTACNVSGDNAIGVIVDTIYKKFIAKTPQED